MAHAAEITPTYPVLSSFFLSFFGNDTEVSRVNLMGGCSEKYDWRAFLDYCDGV